MITQEILKLGNNQVLLLAMDGKVKKGAIGVSEGELITKAFELATKKKIPIITIITSSGINVQDNVLGLMQMSKICTAVKKHSNKGLLFISVIRDYVLGGASASFVSLADIIIAEEGALYGFSGKNIILKTTRECLPSNFQTAEYCLNHGMIDMVVRKDELFNCINMIVQIHSNLTGVQQM